MWGDVGLCAWVVDRADFQGPRPEASRFCWERLHMPVFEEESKEDSF